jgi:hypothetical protein
MLLDHLGLKATLSITGNFYGNLTQIAFEGFGTVAVTGVIFAFAYW